MEMRNKAIEVRTGVEGGGIKRELKKIRNKGI